MKSLRLFAFAILISACTASAALACDDSQAATSATNASTASATKQLGKGTTASGCCTAHASDLKTAANTAHSGCTAEMAAQSTPAMRAACEKNAAVAAAMGCNMKGATSVTSATTAAMPAGARCDMAKAANAASGGTCKMKGSATAASMDHCAKGKNSATSAAVAGMRCSAHMKAVAHECSACEDWANCEQDVRALGAKAQVVALKNGAMIVYTADSQSGIKALQSVVSKRNEKMIAALSAGSDKQLCDECKQLRGAMASGKLHREVVNVERGCMTLITSNDRVVVQKIRAMTGQPVAMR